VREIGVRNAKGHELGRLHESLLRTHSPDGERTQAAPRKCFVEQVDKPEQRRKIKKLVLSVDYGFVDVCEDVVWHPERVRGQGVILVALQLVLFESRARGFPQRTHGRHRQSLRLPVGRRALSIRRYRQVDRGLGCERGPTLWQVRSIRCRASCWTPLSSSSKASHRNRKLIGSPASAISKKNIASSRTLLCSESRSFQADMRTPANSFVSPLLWRRRKAALHWSGTTKSGWIMLLAMSRSGWSGCLCANRCPPATEFIVRQICHKGVL
jgi:hypothetical protein